MKFQKKTISKNEIPTASLPDIVFLLLIFFMVSTVFAIEEGLLLQLPSKEGVVKKISRKNIMRVTAYPDGAVTIDDQPVTVEEIKPRVEQAMVDNPKVIIVVETHRDAKYGLMVDVLDELKLAEADIQIALENVRSAENTLAYTKRMARKGFVSSLQREADEFAVERAKLDLDATKAVSSTSCLAASRSSSAWARSRSACSTWIWAAAMSPAAGLLFSSSRRSWAWAS